MDSITQGLLGATIAEAGFRRRLGGRAVAWGAFCGIAPDLDLVAAIGDEWGELLHHRGMSHSLLVLTAVAPVLGALAWRFVGARQGGVVDWMHLTFWALITHPLLDLCTAYGTQLLAPLSTERFAIDAVSIVDLAYSVPLAIAVVRAWRGRDRKKSARFAAAMLVITTGYLGFGFVQSQRAIAWAEEDLRAMGFASVETRALPTIGNLFVHRVIARDGRGGFRAAIVSLSAPRPRHWVSIDDELDPLIDRARATEEAQIFEWFAMGFSRAELIHEDDGFTVRFSDVRYGSMTELGASMWGADARFDADGALLGVERWSAARERDMGAELGALFDHLTGTVPDGEAPEAGR